MDALSEALGAVRVTGAIFFDVACTAPWGFAVPSISGAGPLPARGVERVVSYHLITDGKACVSLPGMEDLWVRAGDLVVLPHGHSHEVSRGSPAAFADGRAALGEALSGHPRTVQIGGGGEATHVICGFFGCERIAERLFLAGLPPVFKVHIRSGNAGSWLESTVRHLVDEAREGRPGAAALLSRMSEALFVETLRRYMDEMSPGQTGWLAGARDPIVGHTLALLHRAPGRSWTVAQLAHEVGASRSVLGERFARFLGEPPLAYLTRWRLELAARELERTHKTVLEVALDVGYQSESAFNRAFRREHGLPPARYRRQRREGLTPT